MRFYESAGEGFVLFSAPSRAPNCRRLLKYVRKLPDRSESIHTRVKAADFPCQTQFPRVTDITRVTSRLFARKEEKQRSSGLPKGRNAIAAYLG